PRTVANQAAPRAAHATEPRLRGDPQPQNTRPHRLRPRRRHGQSHRLAGAGPATRTGGPGMTPEEAAQVLAKAACYDPMFSKPSPALANGWADAFTRYGIEVQDAMDAVAEHYVQSPDRVMPAHVIRLARKLRQERSDREGPE